MEFKTYPVQIAAFCALVLASTWLAALFKGIGLASFIIGTILPIAGLVMLEYKRVVVDEASCKIVVFSWKWCKKRLEEIAFSSIKEIEVVKGRGGNLHRGFLQITTERRTVRLTAMGALSAERLDKIKKYIEHFIGSRLSA